MHTEPRSPATPFFAPLHEHKGLENLSILPVAPPILLPESCARPLETVEGALDRLRSAGLLADTAQGPQLHILGGTSMSVESGIRAYHDSFAMFAEPSGQLVVVISGPGQLAEELHVATLAEAVETVLRVYERRSNRSGDEGAK